MPELVGAIICSTRFLRDEYIKTCLILISGSGGDWVLDDLIIVKPHRRPERPETGGLLPSQHYVFARNRIFINVQ